MGFSRQEHWSGLPYPPPGDFPDPGTKPGSPALADGFFTIWGTRAVLSIKITMNKHQRENSGVTAGVCSHANT